jgi:tricorn protease
MDWIGKPLEISMQQLIEQSTTRADVNFVLGELIAELNASHTYVGGGDTENSQPETCWVS